MHRDLNIEFVYSVRYKNIFNHTSCSIFLCCCIISSSWLLSFFGFDVEWVSCTSISSPISSFSFQWQISVKLNIFPIHEKVGITEQSMNNGVAVLSFHDKTIFFTLLTAIYINKMILNNFAGGDGVRHFFLFRYFIRFRSIFL